jgi:hypothetical protein
MIFRSKAGDLAGIGVVARSGLGSIGFGIADRRAQRGHRFYGGFGFTPSGTVDADERYRSMEKAPQGTANASEATRNPP